MEQYKIIQNTKNKKKLGNDFEAKDVWLSKVGNKRLIKFKVHILAYNDYRILEFPNNNENGKELTILNDQDVSGKFNEIRIPPNMKYVNLGRIKGLERILIDKKNENIYIKDNMILSKPKKHMKILLLVMNNMRNGVCIPNDVRRINDHCFHLLHYLQYIYIPRSVTEISSNAFKGLIDVRYIFYQSGTLPDVIDQIVRITKNIKVDKYVKIDGYKDIDLYLEKDLI